MSELEVFQQLLNMPFGGDPIKENQPFVTSQSGLIFAIVCADKDKTGKEAEEWIRRVEPAGTTNNWYLDEMTSYEDGTTNPGPCDDDPNKQHWKMIC